MINPTEADIGRKVIYTGNRYPGGQPEEGVITFYDDHSVFVRYGASGSRLKLLVMVILLWLI